MTVLAQLEHAHALLRPTGAWCQRAYARDAAGRDLKKGDAAATCWCLSGALAAAGVYAYDEAYQRLRTIIRGRIGKGCLITWNDAVGRTQAEVLSLLNLAIATERARA